MEFQLEIASQNPSQKFVSIALMMFGVIMSTIALRYGIRGLLTYAVDENKIPYRDHVSCDGTTSLMWACKSGLITYKQRQSTYTLTPIRVIQVISVSPWS